MFSEDKKEDINNKLEDVSSAEEVPAEDVSSAEESPTEDTRPEKDTNLSLNFIIGKKLGMTRVFSDKGLDFPVTIIEAGPCPVVQIKTKEKEGYSALQLGFTKDKNPNKPLLGHFKKNNINECKKVLKEFKYQDANNDLLGKQVTVNSFSEGDIVNITGKSKGKGFAGHMKRHNFSGGRASHGKNSVMRKAGSVGAGTWPGKIWKGTRMAGRMGGDNITIKNLKVIKVDDQNNLLFIKGAIPGPSKSIIYIEK